MAGQRKTLPARRPRSVTDESLLIRSAESLGRMIGSLQRQLDGASKKLTSANLIGVPRVNGHASNRAALESTTTAGAKPPRTKAKTAARPASASAKVRSTADRTSKRASKAAGARKSSARSGSGASRKPAKR